MIRTVIVWGVGRGHELLVEAHVGGGVGAPQPLVVRVLLPLQQERVAVPAAVRAVPARCTQHDSTRSEERTYLF